MTEYEYIDMHDVREGDEQRVAWSETGWAKVGGAKVHDDGEFITVYTFGRNEKGFRGSNTFPTSFRPVFRRPKPKPASAACVIGLLNSPMFGTPTEPGEHVDWSEPDYFEVADFEDNVEQTIEAYAADNPHMIVWEANQAEG